MTNKVEDYFITPLESHFESQPTEGQRETILADMESYSEEQLNEAVEWLKRARQSAKTFPAPKECIRAIQAVRTLTAVTPSGRPAFHDDLSYGEKLKLWHEATKPKGYPVIKKGTTEWAEWEIYFLAMDNQVQYPIMSSRDSWTVPTRLPSQFDGGYDWSRGDRLLRERTTREVEMDAPDRRRFVQEELRRARVVG
jgi:hypothetical protein